MSDPNMNMVQYHVTNMDYEVWLMNDFNRVSLTRYNRSMLYYYFDSGHPALGRMLMVCRGACLCRMSCVGLTFCPLGPTPDALITITRELQSLYKPGVSIPLRQ